MTKSFHFTNHKISESKMFKINLNVLSVFPILGSDDRQSKVFGSQKLFGHLPESGSMTDHTDQLRIVSSLCCCWFHCYSPSPPRKPRLIIEMPTEASEIFFYNLAICPTHEQHYRLYFLLSERDNFDSLKHYQTLITKM